ncbi:MAG: flagellar biosynthetic protein FliR [Christensenellaceae bacterium]|jgi:flagellar biosynthetic protein FliR
MDTLITALVYNWDYFLLLFLRVSGLIFSSPIFGRRNIPNTVKIGYCACIALLFYTGIPELAPISYGDDIFIYILLCVKELLFGVVFGYVLNLFFTLTFTAGQMIDMQMGFGMVNVFDVQSNLSIPMTGNFYNIIMLVVFFMVDGHHKLVQIMYASVIKMPIGSVTFNPAIGLVAAELFVEAFVLAAIVAMPIIGSGLLGEACLGILMRVVPQMNAFSIGMPMKVILGFIVMFAVMPIYVPFTTYIFDQMYVGFDRMFATMTG